MEHLLFAGYLVLFAWIITKIKFFTSSGLTNAQLIILFLLKVLAGIFYGWIGVYYGQMAQMIDTWGYFIESKQETDLLLQYPAGFFGHIFQSHYDGGYAKFFSTENSWWNDIKGTFLVKLMAVFNVFSLKEYYINVIFICFLTFFGPVALFRVMRHVFPGQKMQVLLACFLLPSFLYWTSGLHKEGLIFTGLATMIYHCYFGFREGFTVRKALWILGGFLLVLILRNFLVITIIPPLIAWFIAEKTRMKPLPVFVTVALVFGIAFFTAKNVHPGLDFAQATVNKQMEFQKLGGGSAVHVQPLEPRFTSFLANAPQALALSMIRPYPSDVRHLLSLAAALEINFLLLLFVVFIIWRRPTRLTPFLLFSFFLALAILMMIGYTVNILGAIVRYRSIVLPLLVAPMVASTDWHRILRQLGINIYNNNNIK